ncbi:MAG: hypothetical protein RIG63_20510 [Coleofasciculus chthonoplastes F3-SA18-01]|uniref:hypothetical protein n=1 Tax=Coleofasciculus chthonoplastes TaxID=64178 RepID=UPI0032F3BD8A
MPRQQYYFYPFGNIFDLTIQDTKDKYSRKNNCTIIKAIHQLQHIEDSSTLLIDGHCGESHDLIASHFEDDVPNKQVIKAGVLALTKLNNNLPKNHIKIRLLGCYGGIKAAPEIARLLGTICGYQSIVVGGYSKSVFVDPKSRHIINLPDRDPIENSTNSGYVLWYNSQGTSVAKPNVQSDPNEYNPHF